MVYGVEGFLMEDCKSAGGKSADQEGTEEAWGVSDSYGVNF